MATPGPLDAVAYIAIELYGDGSLRTSGNIADKRFALQLLDHARDAIIGQLNVGKPGNGLLIPASDVEVTPTLPLTQYGDLTPELVPKLKRGVS